MIYALNRKFCPAPKWRTFHSYELKRLPRGYEVFFKEAILIKGFSVDDFRRRLNAIQKMWREIVPEIEDETGLTLDHLHGYYVEKILRQPVPPQR